MIANHKMARTTLSKVNAALRNKFGNDLELVKGNGYYYFCGGDSAGWYESGVYGTFRLNGFSVDGWVAIAVERQAEYESDRC